MTRHHHAEIQRAQVLLVLAVGLGLVAVLVAPALLFVGHGATATTWGVVLVVMALGVGAVAVRQVPASGLFGWWRMRRTFRIVCERCKLTVSTADKRLIFPRLDRYTRDGDAWEARITPLLGQSFSQWEKGAEAMAVAFSTPVRLKRSADGTLTMRAGYREIQAEAFRLSTAEPTNPGGEDWAERLAFLDVGVTEDGQPAQLPMSESHLLIAGKSGSGKGSVVWACVLGVLDGVTAGTVQLWGLDPKGMELAIGRELFGNRYAVKEGELVDLLERAVTDMQGRADLMAGRSRRFVPSVVTPLNIIVIDELAYLSSMLGDRKMQERANKALKTLLVLGRAVGYSVIGAAQDPRKETLPMRDLFLNKVALRLDKPMVDLALGTGMYEAGAHCDQIPASQPGTAYFIQDGNPTPFRGRVFWVSDEDIRTATTRAVDASTGGVENGNRTASREYAVADGQDLASKA